MAELVLTASTGRSQGTRSSRRLRAEGTVPGVVYGLGEDPVAVSIDYAELRSVMTTEAGLNVLITLDVEGSTQLCIVKDLQRHPVRNDVIHVDFIRLDPNAEVAVDVPVILEGEAKKVIQESGMVDQTMFTLHVLSKPNAIPNELTFDVSEMEVGESVRVEDLELPDGVRTEIDPDETIATGTVTRSTLDAIAEEEAAAAAALLEGEEGEVGVEHGGEAEAVEETDAE